MKRSKYLVSVKCDNPFCGKIFDKYKGEYNRSIKLGRKQYCSLHCYGIVEGKKTLDNISPEIKKKNADIIKKYCGCRRDQYTPFRYLLKCIKNNNRLDKWIGDIDLFYLVFLWKKQKGICPYTGWKMELPLSSVGFKGGHKKPNSASIDRIDSSKGYTKNNIQFVSYISNVAKHNFHDKDLLKFCKSVVKYNK